MPEQKIQTIAKIEYADRGALTGAVSHYHRVVEKRLSDACATALRNSEREAADHRKMNSIRFFVNEYRAVISFVLLLAVACNLVAVLILHASLAWKIATIAGPCALLMLMGWDASVLRKKMQRSFDLDYDWRQRELDRIKSSEAADAANPLYRYADAVDRATGQLHALLARWNSYVMRRDLGLAERNPDEEKIMHTLLAAREDMERRVRRAEYLLASRDAKPQQPTDFLASLEDVRMAERDLCDTTATETYRVAPLSGQRVDLSALQLRLGGDPSSDADPEASDLSLEQAEADALAAVVGNVG